MRVYLLILTPCAPTTWAAMVMPQYHEFGQVAPDGIIMEQMYCSDAPCLPSRAALISVCSASVTAQWGAAVWRLTVG